MRYMVVNLDKQQYFRPVELGGSHCKKWHTVAGSQDGNGPEWLLFIAHLLESRAGRTGMASVLAPWYGAWAGDRVVIVRGDDRTGRFLPEDLQALNALGADIQDYHFLRDNYEDITGDLKKGRAIIDPQGSSFHRITMPPDYGWLTTEVAAERIEFARSQGHDFYRGYLVWASGLKGLRPAVRTLVTAELERLNQQATPQGSTKK